MTVLEAVASAITRAGDADAAITAAMQLARDEGETLQAIGEAAGMSRAGVLKRLNRAR